ncbi:MAG TPA: glycoside hydrolase family 2 TIM barrel-domain containing protein [Paludibacter sp.]|nr:glycoside hydrolase family 2 TIM barrel-domain containing protein [Paludibacter sp.]
MKSHLFKKLFVLLTLFAGLCSATYGAKLSTNSEVREKITINREWRFALGDSSNAQSPAYDDSKWHRVGLPHSFAAPYFMWTSVYNGYGWYRKQLDVPALWTGKTVTLEFEGSFIVTEVYVNGTYVGKHVGGYTGFYFDITKYLTAGSNLIAVRVNNYWNARVAPRAGDHQFSGGIYRDVYLNVTDKLHVDWCGTFISTPTANTTSAVCKAQTDLKNDNDSPKSFTIKTDIVDAGGNIVSTLSTDDQIEANSRKTVSQTLPDISNPALWSPASPNMYKAVTTITTGGTVVDHYETKFGIRTFSWTSDQGFFLNGQHFYLLGANVHQDHAGWGDGVANSAIRRDVKLIKDAGFNCIRGSHYPHDPAFTEACDELGVIYFSENAFWGMGGGSGDRNSWGTPSSSCYPVNITDQSYFDASVLSQLKEEIMVHRNRASIAAWSMCNEPFFTDGSTTTNMKKLLNTATDSSRVWDPSRAVAIGGAQRSDIDKLGKGQVAFYNGDGATLYQNPGVPNLVSEYGIDFGARPGTFNPGWGAIQNGLTNRPVWRSGHVVWCGFDHGTVGGKGLALLGLIDYFRIPKRSYYWYQQAYANGISNPVEPAWPTTGTPAKLRIETSSTTLNSTDGTDDAHILVSVLDAQGKRISNNVPVKLSIVSGPGEFPTGKTIDFAPPSTDEASDILINDGQCAIEFRSYYGGVTKIKATATGLAADSVEITTNGLPIYQSGVTPEAETRAYKRFTGSVTPPPTLNEMLLVKNRPVIVSSTLSGSNQSYVNDDNSTTVWKPTTADTAKWCILHMEAVYCVNRIQIEFPTADAYRYVIEVSSNGTTWTKVIDQSVSTNNDKIRMAYGNLGQYVSSIRIRFTSSIAGLAEVKVGGAPVLAYDEKLLTGTIIGTAGSWNNAANATKEAAFDFDSSTFFDAPSGAAQPHWVGLDLGYGAQFNVEKVKFFPRLNLPDRMTNGTFEVANNVDFSDKSVVYTISSKPSVEAYTQADVTNSHYSRYVRYVSPTNSNGNVAELEFYGLPQTTGINPLLDNNNGKINVRYDMNNRQIYFSVDSNTGVSASVYTIGGQVVNKKWEVSNNFSMSTVGLAPGVYIVGVKSITGNYNKKIIVF